MRKNLRLWLARAGLTVVAALGLSGLRLLVGDLDVHWPWWALWVGIASGLIGGTVANGIVLGRWRP